MPENNVKFTVQTRGRSAEFELSNVDFDQKRDEIALSIGRTLIDAAYNLQEA